MGFLDLLAQAGGPTTNAWTERGTVANLSCCKDQARVFNLEKLGRKPDFFALTVVRAGHTLYVPGKTQSTLAEVRQGITDVIRVISLYSLLDALGGGS